MNIDRERSSINVGYIRNWLDVGRRVAGVSSKVSAGKTKFGSKFVLAVV